MPGRRSKRKGAAGEREAVRLLQSIGLPAARASYGQQAAGLPDVVAGPLAVEVKRTERPSLSLWADQLLDRAADEQVRILLWRRNRGPWVAIMLVSDLPAVARAVVDTGGCHGLADEAGAV